MRKLISLFLLGVCAVALASEPAHAASELETWCIAQGAGWQAANDRCLLLTAIHATVSGTLALLPDESISNYGTIINASEIDSDGIIDNFGTLANHGHVRNGGGIYNYTNGQIHNYGTIANESTMANYDTIRNYGTISNTDTINNWGTIYNLCAGVISLQPPVNLDSGAVHDLVNCRFLPVVTRD